MRLTRYRLFLFAANMLFEVRSMGSGSCQVSATQGPPYCPHSPELERGPSFQPLHSQPQLPQDKRMSKIQPDGGLLVLHF